MIARSVLAICMVGFAGHAFALAEVELFSPSKAASFRKAMIASPEVQFDRSFLDNSGAMQGASRRYGPRDVDRLAREMSERYRAALEDAFRRRGFEVAQQPGADVLQVKPVLKDLYLNAPKGSHTGEVRFAARDAGRATMVAEGTDAAGARIFRAQGHDTAGATAGLHESAELFTRVSFEQMFRQWADEVALALTPRR